RAPRTAPRGDYLRSVLGDRAGFRGLVLSDWGAVGELANHGVAATAGDAARLALLAGTDMDMISGSYLAEIPRLVESGRLPIAVVDEAVRRVLLVKEALGLFDDPYRRGDVQAEVGDTLPRESRAAARRAA